MLSQPFPGVLPTSQSRNRLRTDAASYFLPMIHVTCLGRCRIGEPSTERKIQPHLTEDGVPSGQGTGDQAQTVSLSKKGYCCSALGSATFAGIDGAGGD